MDFELNESQVMLKDSITRYLEKTYSFERRRELVHQGGGFSEENWTTFAELGWIGASLPEDVGGLGGSAVETAVIFEAFGQALVVEPLLGLGILPSRILLAAGGAAHELVPDIAEGKARIALAHGEVRARGLLSYVGARAEAAGDGFAINGVKSLVLGGPFADRLIVSARTRGADADSDGIGLFLVPADAPGVSITNLRLADGSRAAEITFDDVKVSSSGVLCPAGDGYAILDHAYAHAHIAIFAEAVGVMDRALWITRDYVKTRNQFGQAIGSFQSVQHRLADMLIKLELARSALFRAIAHIEAPAEERRRALSLAKVQMGKSAHFVGGQAIQLHGGIGITEEYIVGHLFKRLVFLDNLYGSSARQLELLVREG